MNPLITKIYELKKSEIGRDVTRRVKQFDELMLGSSKKWFSELCFCLLTANTSAELGLRIQKEFGYKGFTENKTEKQLANKLKKAKYRFYNRRANFIHLAQRYKTSIKFMIRDLDHFERREYLVKNIKGFGYKESSHFLRNIGYKGYAILDKHIINLMLDYKLIKEKPKDLSKKQTYEEIEAKLKLFSKKLNMDISELDLYLWSMKTGKVLK